VNWIEDFKKVKQEEAQRQSDRDAVRLLDERMFSAKAPEAWDALVDQLRMDCAQLSADCSFSKRADGAITVQSKQSPFYTVQLRFVPEGHFIRVAKSYSPDDGMTASSDGAEKITLKLESGSLVFFTLSGEHRLVPEVSEYLIALILRPKMPYGHDSDRLL